MLWDLPECLDQGQQGACVGFGWTHELLAQPVRVVGVDPFAVYNRAKQLDDQPGEDYEGTSVLAGAKVIQELGHMTEYRWALSIEDVLATLAVHGPVVIGVDWYAGMEDVDAQGYIHPTGDVMGGHCTCLRGVVRDSNDPRGWAAVGRNSWGRSWGIDGGDFRIGATDLDKLRATNGEFCVPVVRL